ncbi:MAG: hypothetical protein WA989_02845 [Henriciella sp.]|uniref:hypothetical protein n=1 Tax=Henriciella sp. TaxID=1968823 RepID=UPI003C785C37
MATPTLSRRGVLVGAVGSAGGVASCGNLGLSAAGAGLADAGADTSHEHHEHGGDHDMMMSTEINHKTLHALLHCKAMSEICHSVCIDVMQTGDTSMADCARRVRETAAICDASITFVTSGSPLTDELLAVCKETCELCKAECDKHADHHTECAECAKSCVDVIEAIGA